MGDETFGLTDIRSSLRICFTHVFQITRKNLLVFILWASFCWRNFAHGIHQFVTSQADL